MKIHTIGIDLGKTNFHLVGLNEVRITYHRAGSQRAYLFPSEPLQNHYSTVRSFSSELS